jgi:hypothetical protein
MNPLNDNDAARAWSAQLGKLAAASAVSRTEPAVTQLDFPTRLAALLDQFRQRRQRQEHAADKLRAQDFVMGG